MSDTNITPNAGSVLFAGNAPLWGLNVFPNTGAANLTGNVPGLIFVPISSTMIFSGLTPVLSVGPALIQGALALSGNAPVLVPGAVTRSGALSLAGLAPTVAATFSATPGVGALSIATGVVSLNQVVKPNPWVLSLAGYQAMVAQRTPAVATSGILDTYTFSPELTECLEDAFERAGMNPQTVGEDHLESAFRSIKFMLNSEWSTLGIRQWMVQQTVQPMSVGLSKFDAPAGCIDMLRAVLLRNSRSTPINRISRDDYLFIADKTLTGRPDRYFVDRQYNKVTAYIWRLGENTTDQIIYNWFRQITDVGDMGNSLQMPTQMMEAFVCGLAARLAQKFNRALFADLQIIYRGPTTEKIGGMLQQAMMENRERADCYITYSDRR